MGHNTAQLIQIEILESSLTGACGQWRVPVNLPYLNGHFDNNPIVPGVVFLEACVQMAKALHPVELREVVNSKFSQPLRPDDLAQIQLSWLEASTPEERKGQFVWQKKGTPVAQMQIRFAKRSEP